MWKQYFTIGFRQLKKHMGYTLVHIFGLSIAFCVAIILFMAADFERSFDRFHTKGKHLYQVYYEHYPQGNPKMEHNLPIPFAPQAEKEFAGIQDISRYADVGGVWMQVEEKRMDVTTRFVDPAFLQMFSFPLLSGDSATALKNPENLVITQHLALRLFGETGVVGKNIQVQVDGEERTFVISGVLKDLPVASSFQFEALGNFQNFVRMEGENARKWNAFNHNVFVELQADADPLSFQKQARAFTALHFQDMLEGLAKSGAQKNADGLYAQLKLLPLDQVHYTEGSVGNAQVQALYPFVLFGISLFILLIACSNFINLNLAASFQRHKEIGMRKTLGGLKGQITRQFWLEAFLVCLFSLFVGLMLTFLLLPEFNALTGYTLRVNQIWNGHIIMFLLALLLGVSLIAGGYPAWKMGRFNTLKALAGEIQYGDRPRLAQVLAVLQFSFSMLMIMTALVAAKQLQYVLNKPLGYNQSAVISIPIAGSMEPGQAMTRMRHALSSLPFVESVTGTEVNMGLGRDGARSRSNYGFDYQGRVIHTDWIRVDYDYLRTLEIPLLQGRTFSPDHPGDSTAIIINEAMAQSLGPGDWVGKRLPIYGDQPQEIIGIMKNFHTQTLHEAIPPLTISMDATQAPLEYIFVRVRPGALKTALEAVEHQWAEIAPQVIAPASYLDQNVQRMYGKEKRLAGILSYGSLIAILIACVGLFSLTALLLKQKIKEIGIRKVLGAGLGNLLLLLGSRYVKLIGIAFLISAPAAWMGISTWLDGFVYQIASPVLWVFIAGMLVFVIALITVISLVFRAVMAKPVHTLRSE